MKLLLVAGEEGAVLCHPLFHLAVLVAVHTEKVFTLGQDSLLFLGELVAHELVLGDGSGLEKGDLIVLADEALVRVLVGIGKSLLGAVAAVEGLSEGGHNGGS